MKADIESIYGMKIIPTDLAKLRELQLYKDCVRVNPITYDCMKILGIDKWSGFFNLVGIKIIDKRKVFDS